MTDIWVGIIAVVVGALFCFRGSVALRAIISIWGAFVGFWAGAALAAAVGGGELLTGVGDWIAAVLGALVFGGLAYAFYALAVAITMGSIGYGLGLALASLLNVTSDGGVLALGVVGALALAALAFATNLPRLLLIVLSASAGATVILVGVMVLVGAVDLAQATNQEAVQAAIAGEWWWPVAYLGLAISGAVAQVRSGSRAAARTAWEGGGAVARR